MPEVFYAYHAVTGSPMALGQHILFDETHHSGVWERVQAKLPEVEAVYANPAAYADAELDHHLSVALRELALEEVRREQFPDYPSRMSCLYVSEELENALLWAKWFREWGRPTFQVVKLRITGRRFIGDANNCFDGGPDRAENLRQAEHYWRSLPNADGERPIPEMLVDGEIEVVEIIETY